MTYRGGSYRPHDPGIKSLAEANAVWGSKRWKEGLVIHGNCFATDVRKLVDRRFGANEAHARFPLIICDPPYGVLPKARSKTWTDTANYDYWWKHCAERATDNGTVCMWGGVGKPGNRPFLEWCSRVEKESPGWHGQFVTWSKKRAYGTSTAYLFTREECFILSRGKPTFNVPLLSVLRGYAGFSEKYPAKSAYLRRTLIWHDISELFSGKIHPCAGSGTTARACVALGRRYCIIEEVREHLEKAHLM